MLQFMLDDVDIVCWRALTRPSSEACLQSVRRERLFAKAVISIHMSVSQIGVFRYPIDNKALVLMSPDLQRRDHDPQARHRWIAPENISPGNRPRGDALTDTLELPDECD